MLGPGESTKKAGEEVALRTGRGRPHRGRGVVKLPCDNCGYVALFDAETVRIRGLWDKGRDL